MLLPTTLVGSYPQPDWLIDRDKLAHQTPPRVRAQFLWRIAPEWLEQAHDDATLLAIRDQERAGLDILTDGEMRRESYSNRFATALEGIDLDNPGEVTSRSGQRVTVPRVVGKIRRKHPVQVRGVQFLRANTDRKIKITVQEILDLFAAGADVVQIDEPWMEASPGKAREYGLAALSRTLEGTAGKGTTALHICFGYAALVPGRPAAYSFLQELENSPVKQVSIETAQSSLDCAVLAKLPSKTIMLGVLDLFTHQVETPEIVAARIRRALPYISADRLVIAPDCGLKYLSREAAFGKMKAMVDGAASVRRSLS